MTAASASEIWVVARASNPGTSSFSGYQLQWTTGGQLRFYRSLGTTYAQLGATLTAPGAAAGRRIGLRVQGTVLTAYVDSGSGFAAVGTATDSSVATGSYIGIDARSGAILDDFGGGAVAPPPPPPPPPTCQGVSYVCADPASFPKMSTYLSFAFDPSSLSRFALNVVRGCYPQAADKSFALNPRQVNLIVPGTSVSTSTAPGPGCGSESGFGVTYGSGYWRDATTITSPYPGIGTIRPVQPSDYAHYTDGTVDYGGNLLNMFASGSSSTTAEWAALLKAHWTLADLGGSMANHPGVQGVYGDNFSWWQPYWPNEKLPSGAPLNGTGLQWDDGLVRNAQTLQRVLGSNTLLGGNGAGWTCSGFSQYSGDIPGGNCIADVAKWENTTDAVKVASGWDVGSRSSTAGSRPARRWDARSTEPSRSTGPAARSTWVIRSRPWNCGLVSQWRRSGASISGLSMTAPGAPPSCQEVSTASRRWDTTRHTPKGGSANPQRIRSAWPPASGSEPSPGAPCTRT